MTNSKEIVVEYAFISMQVLLLLATLFKMTNWHM